MSTSDLAEFHAARAIETVLMVIGSLDEQERMAQILELRSGRLRVKPDRSGLVVTVGKTDLLGLTLEQGEQGDSRRFSRQVGEIVEACLQVLGSELSAFDSSLGVDPQVDVRRSERGWCLTVGSKMFVVRRK